MTFLVERLAELRRHLQHLRELRPRVTSGAAIEADLTLHNDVLFSFCESDSVPKLTKHGSTFSTIWADINTLD